MPEIRRIELRRFTSIGAELHAASVDLLPPELAKDDAVRWILQFDALERPGPIGESDRNREQDGVASIVGKAVALQLQKRLSVYYAALFHIGRMQTVANTGLHNISSLKAKENWNASISNLVASVVGGNDSIDARGNMGRVLNRICDLGSDRFQVEQRRANNWWSLWLDEVKSLRNSMEHYNESWAQAQYLRRRPPQFGEGESTEFLLASWRIWWSCTVPTTLITVMNADGVRMKPEINSNSMSEAMPLIIKLLSSERHFDELHRTVRMAMDIVHEWVENDKKRRDQPQLEIAISILRAKYGSSNPFAEYAIGNRIATPELRTLVKENHLPDGSSSPWLDQWKRGLESPIHLGRYSGKLDPPRSLDAGQLESVIRAVDSTLKIHVEDKYPRLMTWEQFLQFIYEKHCIEQLGEGAGAANHQAGKSFSVWTIDSFSEYLRTVTTHVNQLGYVLTCPPDKRLRTLLEKTSKGDSLYSEGSW